MESIPVDQGGVDPLNETSASLSQIVLEEKSPAKQVINETSPPKSQSSISHSPNQQNPNPDKNISQNESNKNEEESVDLPTFNPSQEVTIQLKVYNGNEYNESKYGIIQLSEVHFIQVSAICDKSFPFGLLVPKLLAAELNLQLNSLPENPKEEKPTLKLPQYTPVFLQFEDNQIQGPIFPHLMDSLHDTCILGTPGISLLNLTLDAQNKKAHISDQSNSNVASFVPKTNAPILEESPNKKESQKTEEEENGNNQK